MQIIPLRAIPAQELQVILDGQECTIALFWRWGRLYMDLTVGAVAVCRGAICQNGASIMQFPSTAFVGSLHFWDILGKQAAPQFDGLGGRFCLIFLSEGEEAPESLRY